MSKRQRVIFVLFLRTIHVKSVIDTEWAYHVYIKRIDLLTSTTQERLYKIKENEIYRLHRFDRVLTLILTENDYINEPFLRPQVYTEPTTHSFAQRRYRQCRSLGLAIGGESNVSYTNQS